MNIRLVSGFISLCWPLITWFTFYVILRKEHNTMLKLHRAMVDVLCYFIIPEEAMLAIGFVIYDKNNNWNESTIGPWTTLELVTFFVRLAIIKASITEYFYKLFNGK